MDHPMSFYITGWSRVFGTSFIVSLEFLYFYAHSDGFSAADVSWRPSYNLQTGILSLLLTVMFAFIMLLQVWFCVRSLSEPLAAKNKQLFSSVDHEWGSEWGTWGRPELGYLRSQWTASAVECICDNQGETASETETGTSLCRSRKITTCVATWGNQV